MFSKTVVVKLINCKIYLRTLFIGPVIEFNKSFV